MLPLEHPFPAAMSRHPLNPRREEATKNPAIQLFAPPFRAARTRTVSRMPLKSSIALYHAHRPPLCPAWFCAQKRLCATWRNVNAGMPRCQRNHKKGLLTGVTEKAAAVPARAARRTVRNIF